MPVPERTLRVGVVGAAGYVGGEALRLLLAHPRVASVRAYSRSHGGRALASVHPSLGHFGEAVFENGSAEDAAREADVVVFALGHEESQQAMPGVVASSGALIVDLAADFRIRDRALYERYYGEHRCFDLCGSFVYALADVLGPALAGRRRIAAPGCFATATLLALWPLARTGLVDGPAVSFAVTGSSGSGALPKRTTHHPVRAHNLFAYALAGHRHEAEIEDEISRWPGSGDLTCRLLPHSGPFVRGIHATLRATMREPVGDVLGIYREAYAGRPFVRVLGEPPELAAVVGTNWAHVHACAREDGREVVTTVVIDNLIKGAAGQAVQAMNLALGFEETEGLGFPGIYPC